ncbi:MAG: hypothetical protein AB8F78_13255 [Saprospiraceae bacterium]
MNQYQWTFLDNKQQRHTLGIAHSASTGHLVVHCDHRVVLIDFGVLEERTFTFFVEDELCKLTLVGSKEEGFTYNFNIDTEIDTEVNRVRNEKKRTERFKSGTRLAIVFGAVLAMVLGVAYWGYSSKMERLPFSLRSEGVQTTGEFLSDGKLEFIAGNEIIRGRPLGNDLARLNRISFNKGEQLSILFDESSEGNFIIDWPTTLAVLKTGQKPDDGVGTLLQLMNRELPSNAGAASCAFLTAEKISGAWSMLGLIDAYVLEKPEALKKWGDRFRESAYQTRIQQVCPSRTEVLSPER